MRQKQTGPRCHKGGLAHLTLDGTYRCTCCGGRRPRAVVVPVDPDLIADLRATPGVRFLDGPGSSPPYVVVDDPRVATH